jgi:RNA polymerase sigma factor (sigma-70 family)
MIQPLTIKGMPQQDQQIAGVIERERKRLRNFIRKWVSDEGIAEDILQDVFYELIEAYRLMKPIEQVGAWLFRVARNRITDVFRRRKSEQLDGSVAEDRIPQHDVGPEEAYLRNMFWDALEAALEELPGEQRDVFIAHQFEGRSFKQLAAETGVSVNTLISRKHYAVLHLRRRLQTIHNEFAQE